MDMCREHFITGFPSIRVFRRAHDDIYIGVSARAEGRVCVVLVEGQEGSFVWVFRRAHIGVSEQGKEGRGRLQQGPCSGSLFPTGSHVGSVLCAAVRTVLCCAVLCTTSSLTCVS